MTNLLIVSSSPSPATSLSRQMADVFSSVFQDSIEGADVTYRDLALSPPPHLDEQTIGAFYTPADQLTSEQRDNIALSNALVAELEAADVIVIGAPMHNFSIPSSLKAYLDHVTRVGRTFQYGENGPEGLLGGKKVYVLTARGGNYSDGPMAALDHQEPYLKTILGFIGLQDVTFVHTQGIAMGDDVRDQSIAATKDVIAASISALAQAPMVAAE